MAFSTPPPSRADFTDRGSEWVDALVIWLRQFQDYVNRIARQGGGSELELATVQTAGIPAYSKGYVAIDVTDERREVYNPGPDIPGVSWDTGRPTQCWVQRDTIVGWFC